VSMTTPPPFELFRPAVKPIPLLLDSPHSGTFYPEDFASSARLSLLRTAEDTHVERLFANAVHIGATLLVANYPRAYVDCNRRADDIDPLLLNEPWPNESHVSEKSKLGYGLIWRKLDSGVEVYDRRLSAAEIQSRIDRVYRPYWGALCSEADHLHQKFGVLYHLNCHSMPARATHASHLPFGTPHADIVLGDRDGTSCDRALVELMASSFKAAGLSVKINDPYKGVEIVRAMGNAAHKKHSIQIEINRALYMDENTRETHRGFAELQQSIDKMLRTVAAYVLT
jgi:N-formylglutamate deformylase